MRGRRSTTGVAEIAWGKRHRALLVKEQAKIPPAPDPVRENHAYIAWVRKYAQTPDQWSEEFKSLMAELPELRRLKFRKAREREILNWILYLRMCENVGMGVALVKAGLARAPFNLLTCRLGSNPDAMLRKPSELLLYLTHTVIRKYPLQQPGKRFPKGETELDRARRLYDAIRHWRESRRLLTE